MKGRAWWVRGVTVGIGVLLAGAAPGQAEPHLDHSVWDAILKRFVNGAGLVNYAALKEDRAALDGYLASVSTIDVSSLPHDAQLAFWINAYNACVVRGILDRYPVKSVKDIKGFFDAIRYSVAGASLTLNEIEAKGRALGDWRIHFGVVCASSSCPFLRNEAYAPERIEAQLTEQTTRFLGDPARGLRVEGRTLWLSKIFQWYAADFVPGVKRFTPEMILPVITPYIPRDVVHQSLYHRELTKLKFLDYNWSLNDVTAEAAE